MDFIGREDPVRRLRAWLAGDDLRTPLSIVSISGPGGIGKTFVLDHAINSTPSFCDRKYLRLTLSGASSARTLGQAICHDLVQSCSQFDTTGKGYFIETRKNLEELQRIDDWAKAEVEHLVAKNPELRETVLEISRLGAGLQGMLPVLKKWVDLTKVKEEHVDSVLALLAKAKAYRQEQRLFGGILPDIRGKGRRNRLRSSQESAVADGLVADLSAILSSYRKGDRLRPMPSKVSGLDRLLLVLDDYESMADSLSSFLGEHLVPLLKTASFETLLVVVGRDRLADTHPIWRQRHEREIVGELRLTPFDRQEAAAYVRMRGITDEANINRILDETAGYPYLLAGEVEAELHGGRSALGLKSFYDRTTRWMTPAQRSWLVPLCFVDDVNEETIAATIADVNAKAVLEWFKNEASVRSPTSMKWEVLPIIRSRICAYLKIDSPKRHRELQERAAKIRETLSTVV